jgi:hypothetical protein
VIVPLFCVTIVPLSTIKPLFVNVPLFVSVISESIVKVVVVFTVIVFPLFKV